MPTLRCTGPSGNRSAGSSTGTRTTPTIPAGSSYNRRIADNPRYTNAYNWTHLDLETGRGVVYLRRWSEPRGEWIADVDATKGGRYVLKSLPKGLASKPAGGEPAAALASLERMWPDFTDDESGYAFSSEPGPHAVYTWISRTEGFWLCGTFEAVAP